MSTTSREPLNWATTPHVGQPTGRAHFSTCSWTTGPLVSTPSTDTSGSPTSSSNTFFGSVSRSAGSLRNAASPDDGSVITVDRGPSIPREQSFGSLDIVVNNAGYADSAPIEEMSEESFRDQIETNLFGVVNVTRAALPIFRQQRSGHFLQFSSIGGRVGGSPGLGAYQTAKFAVEGFSEVLNAEVKPFGIKVTIVEPGGFRTDWGGSSMHTSTVGADYEDTVGTMNRFRESTVSTWRGDPKRAANILLDLVDLDEPPLRLLLGDGAVRSADKSSRERAAEAEQWAEVSRSADFPEGE